MGQFSFNIQFSKNDGLAISPSELVELYLYGIPLCSLNGMPLSMNVIKQKLIDASASIESWLSVKIVPSIVEERQDFTRREFEHWGGIKCQYPVVEALSVKGIFNTVQQTDYPYHWLNWRRVNDHKSFYRMLFITPNNGGIVGVNTSSYSGMFPILFSNNHIPNYWFIKYKSGYDNPDAAADLYAMIGKLAAIQILSILGDVLLGIGLSSQSLSMDGLSQSVSMIKSGQATIFSSRIKQYLDEIQGNFAIAERFYKGITLSVA